MPWLRNAHRHTKTRWTLTVLAVAFLTLWIVGGWWTLRSFSSNKRVLAQFYGSNVSLTIFAGPVEDRLGLPQSRLNAQWSPGPATLLLRLSGWQYFRFTCTLLLPAAGLGLAAGFLWYRRSRPFQRPDRPNRSRQFKKTCWAITIMVPIFLAPAIVGQWFHVNYQGPRLLLQLERGVVHFHHSGYRATPNAYYPGWQISRRASIATPELPRQITIGGIAFSIGFSRGLSGSGAISLWFLTACFATIAGTFWFIRLRRYPSGRCATCQYDLTGLAANTPCPECGSAAQAPRSTAT